MKPRLLIVTDDERFARSLELILQNCYEVGSFIPSISDPVDVIIKYLRNNKKCPDVILLEVYICNETQEQMIGIEVLNWLRLGTIDKVSFAPVIMISCDSKAYLVEPRTSIILEAPGSYFVKVPFYVNEFRDILANVKPLDENQKQQIKIKRKHLFYQILNQKTHSWIGNGKPLCFLNYQIFLRDKTYNTWQNAIEFFQENRLQWQAICENELPDLCMKACVAGFVKEANSLDTDFKCLIETSVKFQSNQKMSLEGKVTLMDTLVKMLKKIREDFESMR